VPVLVEVGPVPSTSVIAWVVYARAVLSGFGLRGANVEADLGAEVVQAFRGYLEEWEATAARSSEFKWSADVNPESVQYLVHAFYRVAQRLADAAEQRGTRLMPPEAEAFNTSLVTGLLDSLEAEGEPMAAFAEELRGFWPGLS
jgi:hypothetical protein